MRRSAGARRLFAAGAGCCSARGQCCLLPGRRAGPAQLPGQLQRLRHWDLFRTVWVLMFFILVMFFSPNALSAC